MIEARNSEQLTFITRVIPDVVASFGELKEAAQMTYWNPEITPENFPASFSPREGKLGEQELGLHHFDPFVSNDEATARLQARGLERVTEFRVFLAYIAANPDLQREFPILSGATWRGSHNSVMVENWLVLAHGDARRRLFDLSLIREKNDAWRADCRFLVRRV